MKWVTRERPRNDIHENEMSGIRVHDSAAPSITGNDIHENEVSGIGVSEGATATINGREVTGPYIGQDGGPELGGGTHSSSVTVSANTA
jgi:parallel beta-helix repeat protein